MEFNIDQIAAIVGGKVKGDGSIKVNKLDTIDKAKAGSISFLSNPKYESHIYATRASAVIVRKDFQPKRDIATTLVLVEDPYLSFTLLLEEYKKIQDIYKTGIESPSYIGENTHIGKNIYRGAFSYIGNGVKIGDNVKIYPHVFIGDHVHIGNDVTIYAGTKIYANTMIGNTCIIHAGVVIGSDGFGFAPQKDGSYKKIPQVGQVIIEDDVEIGANTVIDCATLDATIIRKGAKIDNLVQIAHNVEVGANTVIAAQSGISGSSKLGKNCVLAGQVGIVGHIEIGENTTIAAQSGITKSFKKDNNVLLGSPGFDHKHYLRSYSVFKNLPELEKRIQELEKKLLNLTAD